jgi:hypothetical protein
MREESPAMTYTGEVHNGTIVLDQPVALPEGSKVECVLLPLPVVIAQPLAPEGGRFAALMQFAGKATGLTEDAAVNRDHYLYGVPKQ